MIMNIGEAIRTIRKNKGLGQKELSARVGISVNALSQIENNGSFPQKRTIEGICNALEVPVSYLLFFSISEEDIPKDKQVVFNSLNDVIKGVLLDTVS